MARKSKHVIEIAESTRALQAAWNEMLRELPDAEILNGEKAQAFQLAFHDLVGKVESAST